MGKRNAPSGAGGWVLRGRRTGSSVDRPGKALVKGGLAAVSIGIVVGGLVATPLTFADWSANPGGVFRDEAGTNWTRIWETWSSWFFPGLLVATVSVGIVLAMVMRLRRSHPGSPNPERDTRLTG